MNYEEFITFCCRRNPKRHIPQVLLQKQKYHNLKRNLAGRISAMALLRCLSMAAAFTDNGHSDSSPDGCEPFLALQAQAFEADRHRKGLEVQAHEESHKHRLGLAWWGLMEFDFQRNEDLAELSGPSWFPDPVLQGPGIKRSRVSSAGNAVMGNRSNFS